MSDKVTSKAERGVERADVKLDVAVSDDDVDVDTEAALTSEPTTADGIVCGAMCPTDPMYKPADNT